MRRREFCAALLATLGAGACGPSAPPGTPSGGASGAPSSSPQAAVARYVVAGDCRGDQGRVVPWAFGVAKARGAAGFVFLGDMELSPEKDDRFASRLSVLAPVPFFPILGNHETAMRKRGQEAPAAEIARVFGAFRSRFLGTAATPVKSVFDDRLVYSIDLPGGVHLVALDNVTRSGFGQDQLAWLAKDLDDAGASGRAKHLVIAMHKALAGSGVTTHAMEEDGPKALADSTAAMALFEKAHVEVILASHYHGYADYVQHGIRSFMTGGMGAPLDEKGPPGHHVIVASVPAEGPIAFEVVPFPGAPLLEAEREQ
jgi:hypothetical protein